MAEIIENLSIEEASGLLEEQLRPETDWPEPSDPLDFAGSERDAIAQLERLERADRESTTGF